MPTLVSNQANFSSFKRTCSIEIDSELIEILSAISIKTWKLVELESSHEHEQLFREVKKLVAASPIKYLRWFRALRSLVPVFACLETFAPLFPPLCDSCFSSTARGPFKPAWVILHSAFFCVAPLASEHSKARHNLELFTVEVVISNSQLSVVAKAFQPIANIFQPPFGAFEKFLL